METLTSPLLFEYLTALSIKFWIATLILPGLTVTIGKPSSTSRVN